LKVQTFFKTIGSELTEKNSWWWDNNKLGQANVTVFAEGVMNTKSEKILKRIQSDISGKCVQKMRAFFKIVFMPNKKNR
jgi:hypothetical protein